VLHQVGVSFDLYYDARKHKIKILSTECMFVTLGKGKGKGKSVPLQTWSGLEGSRKLRFPDFMTTAQDGGKVVNLTHRPPLPSRNATATHFC